MYVNHVMYVPTYVTKGTGTVRAPLFIISDSEVSSVQALESLEAIPESSLTSGCASPTRATLTEEAILQIVLHKSSFTGNGPRR